MIFHGPSGFWIQSGERFHKIGAFVVERRLGKWMVCARDSRLRIHPIKAYSTPEEAMGSVNDGEVQPPKVVSSIVPVEGMAITAGVAGLMIALAYLAAFPSGPVLALLSSLATSGFWFLFSFRGFNDDV